MNAPGESPGAYFLKNMTGIIRTILDNQRKVTLYEFALREIVCIFESRLRGLFLRENTIKEERQLIVLDKLPFFLSG